MDSSLMQHEVNTIDGQDLKLKASQRLARARLNRDRMSGRAALEQKRQQENTESGGDAPPHVTLSQIIGTSPAVGPMMLGDVDLKEGERVYVKDSAKVIRMNSPNLDRTKELYCGEKGRIVKMYQMLDIPGVDLKFPDGETRFFTLNCIEFEPKTAAKEAPKKPASRAMRTPSPNPRARTALKEKPIAKVAPTPTPTTARGIPTTTAPVALPAPNTARALPTATISAATPTPTTPLTSAAKAKARSKSSVTPSGTKVGQRILISVSSRTMQATVKYVGPTSFADGEWAGLELSTPDGKNDGKVGGKTYFRCKPNHGLFRRVSELTPSSNNRSSSPNFRKQDASAPVVEAKKESALVPAVAKPRVAALPRKVTMPATKTIRLWENGQYGSTVDTVPYKSMIIRHLHKTMKAVLNTATRELGWHIMKRSVEILYLDDGTEVSDVDNIMNGSNIIASWGDAFIKPTIPLPAMKQAQNDSSTQAPAPAAAVVPTPTKPKAVNRTRSPLPQAKTRSPLSAKTQGINKIIKVFENGIYGSKWSDTIPCYTVTLRSAFKTVKSVQVMLARELQWNQCGRKVEVIYDTLGREVMDLTMVTDGDVLIASAGDNFVPPHTDVKDRFPLPKMEAEEELIQPKMVAQEELGEELEYEEPAKPEREPVETETSVSLEDRSQADLTDEFDDIYADPNLDIEKLMARRREKKAKHATTRKESEPSNKDMIAQLMSEIADLEASASTEY